MSKTLCITSSPTTFLVAKSKVIDSCSRTQSFDFLTYSNPTHQRVRAEDTGISSKTQDNAQWCNSVHILITCVHRWKLKMKNIILEFTTQRHWAPVLAILKFSPVFCIQYYLLQPRIILTRKKIVYTLRYLQALVSPKIS